MYSMKMMNIITMLRLYLNLMLQGEDVRIKHINAKKNKENFRYKRECENFFTRADQDTRQQQLKKRMYSFL